MDQDIWQNILDKLEDKIAKESFRTWFSNTLLIDKNKEALIICVPTKFASEFLNKNYSEMVSEISYETYKKKYKIQFTHENNKSKAKAQQKARNNQCLNTNLNTDYSFHNFVVGKSNNFAQSAAQVVAESPGTTYNPLFFYGESGMGKTHLMQAIGNFAAQEIPDCNVYYITAENFTNEMINAILSKNMQAFRNKFRKIDLLLVDDIHFISDKEGTQEEFFHTFNALYENKKQIVLASDRPPKDIPDLESRLVSRFEWGLLADLKNPDFETRMAILKKKTVKEDVTLRDEVFEFIAENIFSNVRALEGSLVRILAYCSCNKINPETIDIDLIGEILSDMIKIKQQEITMDTIFHKTCKFYNISLSQMVDKTRVQKIALPRQVAMYLSSILIQQVSLKDIASYYNRNDHTTVLHAKRMIETKIRNDNEFRIQVEMIINEIKDAR